MDPFFQISFWDKQVEALISANWLLFELNSLQRQLDEKSESFITLMSQLNSIRAQNNKSLRARSDIAAENVSNVEICYNEEQYNECGC